MKEEERGEMTGRRFGLVPGLYGEPITSLPSIHYRCEMGPHIVEVKDVMERDVTGGAICPMHQTRMIMIRPSKGEQ